MRTLSILTVLVGCGFSPSTAPSDATSGDAPGMVGDAPSGQTCFGLSSSSLFTQCYASDQLPTNTFAPSTRSFDTITDCTGVASVQTSHGIQVCLIAAQTITINATFTVRGARPLVLLATQTLTVSNSGIIDASTNAQDGPNAGASACNPAGAGGSAGTGGGGGTGGTFGTAGGAGGASAATDNGGTIATLTAAVTLRGGCNGAKGGNANGNNHGGAGGHAGGAVYLLAGTSIHVAGRILASGGGGVGGDPNAGGGGGGTGGLIGLDAPSVSISSATLAQPEVIANGGGGGGGGGGGNSGGVDGGDGTLVSTPGATGGAGGANGLMMVGGDGGGGTNLGNTVGVDGDKGAPGCGGGGGGGGYGIVWVVTPAYSNLNGDLSPSPLVH